VIWIDMDPQAGREQKERRVALVLTRRSYNARTHLAVMCPITNQGKDYPCEVELPAGIKATGFVLADQVKSLDWFTRNASYHSTAPNSVVDDSLAKIGALLEL
jgi:mRNA interferase MazF